MIKQIEG